MINNIFMDKSKLIKIMHSILFVITGLYLLETILIAGLFSNALLAIINIIVGLITLVIAIIKNESKLALIDLAILFGTAAIFIFMYTMQ